MSPNDSLPYLRATVRRFRDEIRRHGLPVEAVRIEDVEAKVGGALDRQTLGFTTLGARAERDALVVPFRPHFVRFAHVAARALVRRLVRDVRLDHLRGEKDLQRRTGPSTVRNSHVVRSRGIQIRHDTLCEFTKKERENDSFIFEYL